MKQNKRQSVFVVYKGNGHGGEYIDWIFDNINLARQYVMTELMVEGAKNQEELDEMCDDHIEEHEVITNLDEI